MIYFDDILAHSHIAKAAQVAAIYKQHRCISRENEKGVVLGGVIFTDYHGEGGSVQIHCAGFTPHWLSRDLLFYIFDYAFTALKVKKVVGIVNSKNARAVRLNTHIGFKPEACIKDIFPDGAALVMTMRPDRCRYLVPPAKLRPIQMR